MHSGMENIVQTVTYLMSFTLQCSIPFDPLNLDLIVTLPSAAIIHKTHFINIYLYLEICINIALYVGHYHFLTKL